MNRNSKNKGKDRSLYYNKKYVFGDYHVISSSYFSEAIDKLLETIDVLAPEVNRDLYDIVCLYKKADNIKKITKIEPYNWADIKESTIKEHIELAKALIDWAKKYHLTHDIYIQAALLAIYNYLDGDFWEQGEEKIIQLAGCYCEDIIGNENEDEIIKTLIPRFYFKPEYEPYFWDPRFIPWKDFEDYIDEQYERYKKYYKFKIELILESRNYIPGKRKRKFDEHIKWFVLYQVKGIEPEEIAQMVTDEDPEGNIALGVDAIKKAIKDIAKIVGLETRSKL